MIMSDDPAVEDVKLELATALGLYALSDATLHDAASHAGVSRWELENAIERAGLEDVFGLNEDADVSETIDELLDGS